MVRQNWSFDMDDIYSVLPADQITENEPMSAHCSFRTGGAADLFIRVNSADELKAAQKCLKDEGKPMFLLGRGTNILVGDGGFRGAVVTMTADHAGSISAAGDDRQGRIDELCAIKADGNRIFAGAGATLAAIAAAARDAALTGLEFASGIPGSVGGGLVMNAGAYGGEMKQVVVSAKLLMSDGSTKTLSGDEMKFGYRMSVLKDNGAAALSAVFELEPDDPETITDRMRTLAAKRREKQPLEYPSAGSTFRRPEGHFAGKLIEEAGLRGFAIGSAGVSDKHCGFVINRGSATSAEIRAVIEAVQKRVYENSGIRLEREVIFLGEF